MEEQRKRLEVEKKKREQEVIICPECKCTFFEEVEISEYKADHWITLGQHVPRLPSTPVFFVLRCVKCNYMLEPRLNMEPADTAFPSYAKLAEIMKDTTDGKDENQKQ